MLNIQNIHSILIVDDDVSFCNNVKKYLSSYQLKTYICYSATECLKIISNENIDLILLDQNLPDMDGYKLVPDILKHNEDTKIIFITGHPSFDNALQAIKSGAYEYLVKPIAIQEIIIVIGNALRTLELERKDQLTKYKEDKDSKEILIVGKGMNEVKKLIKLASRSNFPVLITGETGTGKNIIAKNIHFQNINKPYISVNCATIPENLLEAELFGYDKGAFTGATKNKKGLFELADKGIIFLNEIADLPFHLQAKLLDILDEKKIRRLGSEIEKKINIQIISATNHDIETLVKNRKFREDLYYRLNVLRIHIPPLRERLEDIPDICKYLLKKISPSQQICLSDNEINELIKYNWPGNVRELKNTLERAYILHYPNELKPSELIKNIPPYSNICFSLDNSNKPDILSLKNMEKKYIEYAYNNLSNNKTRTAKTLNISLASLKRKIKLYQIE